MFTHSVIHFTVNAVVGYRFDSSVQKHLEHLGKDDKCRNDPFECSLLAALRFVKFHEEPVSMQALVLGELVFSFYALASAVQMTCKLGLAHLPR